MRSARLGFSLIEALVVLAIGGMALAIIFSIGNKAGETGFALGRRAMDAADADVSVSDLRVILQSFAIRPPSGALPTDPAVSGEADRVEGPVVMKRATVCAPQGWAGSLTLALEPRDGGQVLTCLAGTRAVDMMVFPRGQAGFTYSTDGRSWAPRFSSNPDAFPDPSQLRYLRLYVRLNAPPDFDVIDGATSGSIERWIREDWTL